MTAEELFEKVIAKDKEFGMNPKNEGKTINDPKGNTVVRKDLIDKSFTEGSAFFGLLSADEETTGPYSDFSFVVFPEKNLGCCVVALCVGSSGFKNDYQLASLPGLRRSFLKLRAEDNLTFFKTSFDDIENTSSDLVKEIRTNYPNLKSVIEGYKTVLPATRILDLAEESNLDILYQWLAIYAKMRGWGTAA